MKKTSSFISYILFGIHSSLLLIFLLILFSCETNKQKKMPQQPNVVFILADDLGYGELGCYGQEIIETPHIDKLADQGVLFTQHYSGAPVCAPSRCVLLTGQHTGNALIRGNDEWKSRGDIWSYSAMNADSTLEGQRPLPDTVFTMAHMFKNAGYKTAMIGKWGLGAPHTQSIPNEMGFDFFLGYNCQRQAHTYYPKHLYLNKNRLYLNNREVAPHQKLTESDLANSTVFDDFQLNDYAPDTMFDGMMDFIETNTEHPFFIYWASPIPHMPLQAPQKWVDYYRQIIGEEEVYTGDKGYFPNAYPKATYAAMISYLDERVGQMVKKLKEEGIYENTIIVFTSDNGPTYNGGVDVTYFNSAAPFQNIYGHTKGFLHEGGIRVPLIVSWPNTIKQASISDEISMAVDFFPTFCGIINAHQPDYLDGISLLPCITQEGVQNHHEYLYWELAEYGGQQAVRWGKWKAIRKGIKKSNLEIELYNLNEDEKEAFNIAEQYHEIVTQMERFMQEAHSEAQLKAFQLPALDTITKNIE